MMNTKLCVTCSFVLICENSELWSKADDVTRMLENVNNQKNSRT